MEDRREIGAIGEREGARIAGEQEGPPCGEAARLEAGEEPSAGKAHAHAGEGLFDRCRVMRKVVDHDDAVVVGEQLLAPLDAAEPGERRGDLARRQAVAPRRRPDRQGIDRVVDAPQRHRHLDLFAALVAQAEADSGAVGRRLSEQADSVGLLLAVEDDRRPRRRRQRTHFGAVAAGDDEARLRDQRDEAGISLEQRGRARIEIGVVVLDRSQDQGLGPVVQELGAAVEVGGVVLVSLDDETRTAAEAETRAEVDRHAADEKARISPALRPDRGGHRTGRCLAVRAGHHQRPAIGEEEPRQRLGHRQPREPQPLGFDRLRVVAADGVTDDDDIGCRVEVARRVALPGPDPGRFEQVAHRRIKRPVRTGHEVALRLQQTGEGCHSGTADGDQVDAQRTRSQRGRRGGLERRSTPKGGRSITSDPGPVDRS